MILKAVAILTILSLALSSSTSVSKVDQCNSCIQMKSQLDCQNYGDCIWSQYTTGDKCETKTTIPVVQVNYCSNILAAKCSKTNGCAYHNSECTLFSGCSAYQMTTLSECQSISSKCVTDGKTCINATDCTSYPQTLCEETVNVSGRSCKWDTTTQTCRDFLCSEASVSINTDQQCDAFSAGCITTGIGCSVKPLPSCSSYTGTSTTCLIMKGNDNYCQLNAGTTNCKAKVCNEAPTNTSTDSACNSYQIGCITTGKGCTQILGQCQQYTVTDAVNDCKGYIGTDGICEGDQGATTCRARKCENGTGVTDKACDQYKKGCVTNGVGCAVSKSTCSGYQGTNTTCPNYIATDGNCKGTSDTQAACTLKDCINDSLVTYTTDTLCKSNIQSWCVTTGKGCVKTLQSCTSYTAENTDGSDCLNLIGSEGKCTAGTSGKCAARNCTDAPTTYITNQECSDYFNNCVTNGAGCIMQQSCQLTPIKLTCNGTKEGLNPCYWGPSCVSSTSCSEFKLQSICISSLATIINGNTSIKQACIWDSVQLICKNAQCTDFTGINYQTNDACDIVYPGCVTNGQGCVDPNTCNISFKGNKQECLAFKAYCTNIDQSVSTDYCINRTCVDSGLIYTLDSDCQKYLPECLTNGNGCISNTQPCSGYIGTSQQCDKFYGYYNNKIKGARCWNTNTQSSQCTEKQCTQATGMTQNSDCELFLTGCLYDGGSSCLDSNASCSSYKYTNDPTKCQSFKGVNGTEICYQSTSNQCKKRECIDNTTATTNKDCNTFLAGCRTKGTGCVSSTVPCSQYQGTLNQCNEFVGNSIQCTKITLSQCLAKLCSDKTDASNNQDCITYKSTCRLIQGGNTCQDVKAQCTGYTLSNTATTNDKQTYCNSITISSGNNCAYDANTTGTCVAKSCTLWNSSTGISCVNYLGVSSCLLLNNNYCYAPGACNTYTVPDTESDKSLWCKNMINNSKQHCKLDAGGITCADISKCEDVYQPISALQCNQMANTNSCTYKKQACITIKSDCSQYSLSGMTFQQQISFCNSAIFYNPSNNQSGTCGVGMGNCYNSTTQYVFDTTQVAATCEAIINAQSQANCDVLKPNQCTYFENKCYTKQECSSYSTQFPKICNNLPSISKTGFCFSLSSDTSCRDPVASCSSISLSGTYSPMSRCMYRNAAGILCKYDGTQCVETTGDEQCTLITTVTSDYQCQTQASVGICIRNPNTNICILIKASCTDYTTQGTTDDDKAQVCSALKDTSSKYCAWLSATNCDNAPNTCADWVIPQATVDKTTFCTSRVAVNGTQCAYMEGKSVCTEKSNVMNNQMECATNHPGSSYSYGNCYTTQNTCNLYIPVNYDEDLRLAFCNAMTATTDGACTYIQNTANCVKKFNNCASITGATLQSNCDAYFSNCYYYNSKCYTASNTCNYSTGGSGALAFCAAMKNSLGDFCTAASDTASNCSERTCGDTAANLTTNQACKTYKSTCKSDGSKCIDSSIACSSKKLLDCTIFLDIDNQTQCIAEPSVQGNSCNDNTTLCSSYTGTKSVCQAYLGTVGKCWGDSDSISAACRDIQCTDQTVATKDSDCDAFQSGCIYNGAGCIDKSQPCSSYMGTIETCKNFKAVNGTIPCWGISNTIGACKIKECTDLAGTTDQICSAFIPITSGLSPNCITDGIKCVTYPRNCSQFTGTQDSCSKFTATDGPCKSTAINGQGTCTPRICIEALNTFNTDAQCKDYHPTCVTTGRGCVISGISCTDIQNGIACSSKLGCAWASSCKVSPNQCNELTIKGQSACVNTSLSNGNYCMWSNNICRNFVCTDYDSSITTHQQCQQLDNQCTTSGAGCINLGICSSYTIQSICSAANTTEPSIRCAWENGKCRQRQCKDLTGSTNDDCNRQLQGCKTNGTSCIEPIYECSVFNGNKTLCFSDSQSNPCVYLNDICYKYNSCLDIPYSDFATCQLVSKECVPSSSNCIALRQCSNYQEQISCIIGTNNTTCGWQSANNKCTLFNHCSEYQGQSTQDCQYYGQNCISDGIKCIDKDICSNYLTSISCSTGTDGLCTWISKTSTCRLYECSDTNSGSESFCSQLIVTTGICTTDGIKCIPRAKCTEYQSQGACNVGSDGIPCTFAYPIGQTAGTKSCRSLECSDFTGATNDICKLAIKSKPCVSNGKSCLNQDKCSNYKNQISCNGGGSDGICAFTPVPTATDSLAGTCQLFNSCDKANKDQITCKKNSQACIWTQNISGNTTITTCSSLTCAQKAIGTDCNPIPSFDGSNYTVCGLVNNVCTPVDPLTLTNSTCYIKSQYTYSWDSTTQKCVECINHPTNTTNNSINNTNTNISTNTQLGPILKLLSGLVVLLI